MTDSTIKSSFGAKRVCDPEDETFKRLIFSERLRRKSSALLLSAVLLDQLYHELFQNPFQILDYFTDRLEKSKERDLASAKLADIQPVISECT